MRVCSTCGESGTDSEFLQDGYLKSKDRFYKRNTCKKCHRGRTKVYNTANKAKNRAKYIKSKFGIDNQHYQLMLEKQGGSCAICKVESNNGKNFDIDHDHSKVKGSSGFIRGLLCNQCNQALGLFKDDVDRLERAIIYLT